jgi:hypothetical protein
MNENEELEKLLVSGSDEKNLLRLPEVRGLVVTDHLLSWLFL